MKKRKKKSLTKIVNRKRKHTLLKGVAATGALLGGTAIFGQGNKVYAAEAENLSESGWASESVLEQATASESKALSVSESDTGS